MNLWQEKQTRHYIMFTGAVCVTLILAAAIVCWWQGESQKQFLFQREQAIASSLLQQQVSPETIAVALNAGEGDSKGAQLLEQIGHTSKTATAFFPFLQENRNRLLGQILAFVAGICLILSGGTLFYLGKRERLYEQAQHVIHEFYEGDFHRSLPQNETGGIYQLFSKINQLAGALQARGETEHEMKIFLQNAISDISHQLKTPLAALNMYVEIMSTEPENADTVRNFTEKSALSLKRMEVLLQNLLKIMRLDADSITFTKEACNLKELVEQSVLDLSVRANQEKKHIVIEGREQEQLLCDPIWTGEAIANLVKNALDHTKEKGIIKVSWKENPGGVRIFVEDNGCGIAKEDIYHIFKRFYRSSHSSDTQGAGLGLPLSKAIVEGQGGILTVKSSEGVGTVFTISFPV